jgi:hypothetical protein
VALSPTRWENLPVVQVAGGGEKPGPAGGGYPSGTSRGVETFFDEIKFDPEAPEKYLASQMIEAG